MIKHPVHAVSEHMLNYCIHGPELRGLDLGGLGLPYYTPLVEHLLHARGFSPRNASEADRSLREAIRGKRVFEFGCRSGSFLQYMKDHGAIVGGNTKRDLETARGLLGPGALLIDGGIESASESAELEKFNPEMIFSFNLFDINRRLTPARVGNLLDAHSRFAKRGAEVYARPTLAYSRLPYGGPNSFLKQGHFDSLSEYLDVAHRHVPVSFPEVNDTEVRQHTFRLSRKPSGV